MSDGDTTMACPECDSARISRCGGEHKPPYHCPDCDHRFETPIKRAVKGGGTKPRGGLAEDLLDAKADDVSADP